MKEALEEIFRRLSACYGPQRWWPAETPFEVIVGAVLTQSTAWANVEKAIRNLKEAGVLSPAALRAQGADRLAELIRPCGYYRVKARRLMALLTWLGDKYDDDLGFLFALPAAELRKELLKVYGVGEETADAVILYAAGKPVFVVDAYTQRITGRLGLTPNDGSYADVQSLFTSLLPTDVRLFNEYHALLVNHGKTACRKQPRCAGCCLGDICRYKKQAFTVRAT